MKDNIATIILAIVVLGLCFVLAQQQNAIREATRYQFTEEKLKDYLVKLYERVGNTLRGVKEEPYLIKNCLYILEKVDSIPSYI